MRAPLLADRRLEDVAGHHLAPAAGKVGEDRKLRCRQRDPLSGAGDGHGVELDDDVADRHLRRRVGRASPDDGPQSGEELADGEGLGEIVVGAELEGLDPVVGRPAGRDDDHGHVLRLAQLPEQLDPIHPRQLQVEHDRVERLLQGDRQACGPVGRLKDGVQRFAERFGDRLPGGRVILDHQHPE